MFIQILSWECNKPYDKQFTINAHTETTCACFKNQYAKMMFVLTACVASVTTLEICFHISWYRQVLTMDRKIRNINQNPFESDTFYVHFALWNIKFQLDIVFQLWRKFLVRVECNESSFAGVFALFGKYLWKFLVVTLKKFSTFSAKMFFILICYKNTRSKLIF